MNTQTIETRNVGVGEIERPGDFKFSDARDYLYIILLGRNAPDALRVQSGEQGGARIWGWDGDEERPTLQPSIHDIGHWHGFLTAGVLVSC